MEVFGDKKTSKNIKKYICENCDFKCSKLGDWNRHISTSKHSQLTLANAEGDSCNIKKYMCENCNKNYNSRNGLWKHKKMCQNIINEDNVKDNDTKNTIPEISPELIMNILKQNNDLQNVIIIQNNTILDLAKNNSITNNITNNNNSHNNPLI